MKLLQRFSSVDNDKKKKHRNLNKVHIKCVRLYMALG